MASVLTPVFFCKHGINRGVARVVLSDDGKYILFENKRAGRVAQEEEQGEVTKALFINTTTTSPLIYEIDFKKNTLHKRTDYPAYYRLHGGA